MGVEKEKEIKKSSTANFQREAVSAPRGPDGHPSWVAQGSGESAEAGLDPGGCSQALGIGSPGARANAGRGAAQSQTATIRVRLHSFESFFPSVWSQPSRTGPSRAPEEGAKRGRGAARPTQKRLPKSLDSESARIKNKLPF